MKHERNGNGLHINGTSTKRIKTSEFEEEVKEVNKEYGGLECPVTDIMYSAYVTDVSELDDLTALKTYKVTHPENILQAEKVKGLKDPKIYLYFTPINLRVYVVTTDIKEVIEDQDTGDALPQQRKWFIQDFCLFSIWIKKNMISAHNKKIFDLVLQIILASI